MRVLVRTLALGLTALAALMAAGEPTAAQSKRPTIAVLAFEYGTIQHWWQGTWDIGEGISDMIVDELVNDGSFRVIERKRLDAILAEQNFSNSDRADPSAASVAKIGKALGVKYLVVGSITKFGTENRNVGVGGGAFGGGKFGLGRVGTSKGLRFFVAADVFAQTLDVVRTRAAPLGIEIVVGPAADAPAAGAFGVLLQYPGADGEIRDDRALVDGEPVLPRCSRHHRTLSGPGGIAAPEGVWYPPRMAEPEGKPVATREVLERAGISRQVLYRYMQLGLIVPIRTSGTGRPSTGCGRTYPVPVDVLWKIPVTVPSPLAGRIV